MTITSDQNNQNIEISAIKAWTILSNDKNSCLIDVRTIEEINIFGLSDLTSVNKEIIHIPWITYPQMIINTKFLYQLSEYVDKSKTIFFICKSGVRSLFATEKAIEAGYINCYNIISGFKGEVNKPQEIDKSWIDSNLPWKRI